MDSKQCRHLVNNVYLGQIMKTNVSTVSRVRNYPGLRDLGPVNYLKENNPNVRFRLSVISELYHYTYNVV